jgi:hypothetical protein
MYVPAFQMKTPFLFCPFLKTLRELVRQPRNYLQGSSAGMSSRLSENAKIRVLQSTVT